MSDELDASTLARARAGDPSAFRRLYDAHAPLALRFLARFLGDAAAAEDAVQETFIRVHRALHRFDPGGAAALSTWILTIARRVALTMKAAGARAPAAGPTTADAVAPADERGELRRALDRAVAALPPPQRAVFVLHEGCGLAYREIAAIEAVDVGTVRSRLHRARAALQDTLREHLDRDASDGDEHDRRAAEH